ncbi:HD domain-containing protein [Psychroflexus halocasei]|uniref:HD domain-containing protein n=1 Tax=Psychroflexus halocasei TaxID=908615 RepID=A0A1H3ZM39_9FLAO|nr:HD domain-containing protein [Psychroflexus halocasei]SEA24715.1 HD domain-containing protein [Psychroflexus halocasei]
MNTIDKTEAFAEKLLVYDISEAYLYHNINHTRRVVESAKEILEHTNVDSEVEEIIIVSAWLHDLGYTVTDKGHEEESVKIAENFLKSIDKTPDYISRVVNCIRATKVNIIPKSLEEEIIKDADCSHFASDDFKEISELLRQEIKRLGKQNYTIREWREENIDMLSNKHNFYSSYAIKEWSSKKEDNLMNLIKKKNKIKKKYEKEEAKAKYKAKYKNENPERSIQTLFRITLRNHLKLSDIADTKANILLSVNAIIISLALSNIIPKLDNPSNQHLMIPTLI